MGHFLNRSQIFSFAWQAWPQFVSRLPEAGCATPLSGLSVFELLQALAASSQGVLMGQALGPLGQL